MCFDLKSQIAECKEPLLALTGSLGYDDGEVIDYGTNWKKH